MTDTYYVNDDNFFINKNLKDLDLRAKTDATIIAIVRDGKTITNPAGKEILSRGDTIVITGTHQAVDKAFSLLDGKE